MDRIAASGGFWFWFYEVSFYGDGSLVVEFRLGGSFAIWDGLF